MLCICIEHIESYSIFVLQPLVPAVSNRGDARKCLVCEAARFTPPQAARYTKGAMKHGSCVLDLTDAVHTIATALLILRDG
jgi:hypothetical protein